MNESLSDFQEKKKSCSGPKTTTIAKQKPKKQIKKIKGQKDIRTVLKAKKNELLAYANDFDKICKLSGLDVDSEQLQTAIALSKSLQKTENLEENTTQTAKVLNSQERIGKIRTTLQEYGFKVPEVKITEAKSRKLKRSRKNYKLLQTTDIEKRQIISDRYSHVLIQNLDCIKQVGNIIETIPFCYKIATGIAYDKIRDNNTFYIEGLIKRSANSVGFLLRDWSKIPGRPSSPKIKLSDIDFSDINCNQEELDCFLSGSLKIAQELLKNKYCLLINDRTVNNAKDSPKTLQEIFSQSNYIEEKGIDPIKMDVQIMTIHCKEQSTNKQLNMLEGKRESDIEVKGNEATALLTTLNTHQVRCCSPDIFDDEVSTIMENNCSKKIFISQEAPKDSTKINLDVMDLTECVQVASQKHLIVEDSSIKEVCNFQLSQDKTKRKSNDFMELTRVVGSSQPFRMNTIEENIDLTQNYDHENDITDENTDLKQEDLTQSSDSNNDLPFVQIPGTQALDDTVIMDEEANCGIDNHPTNSSPVIAYLDNNSKTNEEITINKGVEQVIPEHEANHVQTSSGNLNSSNTSNSLNDTPSVSKNYVINNEILSITLNSSGDTVENESIRSVESPPKSNKDEDLHQSNSQSFFEEFIQTHSDLGSKETEDLFLDINHEEEANSNTVVQIGTDNNDNIDLTQSSDNSLVLVIASDEESEAPKISFDYRGLGKKDNISIDYDEFYYDNASKNSTISYYKDSTALKSIVCDAIGENRASTEIYAKESELSSSQTSEVFEISDKELDYSMHKSKLEIDNPCGNFDFGEISVVDNLPDLPSIRQSRKHEQSSNYLDRSEDDSFLPMIDKDGTQDNINKNKGPKVTPCDIEPFTPFKKNLNQVINIETPTNNEYTIKTDQVTPMLNYESMTTPERNRELDKYGLKPFKRKRGKLNDHI